MAANERTDGEAPDIFSPLFLEKLVTPLQYDLLADMLIRKLGKYEIRVTARQRSGLKRWLEQGANGEVPFWPIEGAPQFFEERFTGNEMKAVSLQRTYQSAGRAPASVEGANE